MITEIRDERTSVNIKTASVKKTMLELVHSLCDELASQQINYCHWKSNADIDRSCSGDNDLDLLVSIEDTQKFVEILSILGFKQARVNPEHALPGVLDYYGYDQITGRLVHVHAHYQLIMGHDATKNYHIPIEKAYLESASFNGPSKSLPRNSS